MKVKQFVCKKKTLLKLQLLKTKTYKTSNFFTGLNLENLEYRLIKGLKILYKYHNVHKKFIFLSNFLKIKLKLNNLLKQTIHKYLLRFCYYNNIVEDCFLLKKLQKNTSFIYQSLISQNKHNLCIILNKNVNKMNLNKNYDVKIPIIFINNDFIKLNLNLTYKIFGNFLHKKSQFFILFSLLNSIFKKHQLVI